MTKDVIISLPIPYAIYAVKYTITTLRELDETKALILLAIASNQKAHPTDKLKDILHNIYHLNNNYDDLFTNELQVLITNKTITNEQDQLPSLNSYLGNFIIDEKVQKLLDDEEGGFFGNSEDKHLHSLNLKKGIFAEQTLQKYNQNEKNIIAYTNELACQNFVDKNLTNNDKYDNAINEYINNNLIAHSENLFNHEYKNLSDIESGMNLIYCNTDCKFKLNLEDNRANIFPQGKVEDKIYNDYYLPKVFYQDLLQLLCNKVSCQLTNISEITKLNDTFEFVEDESIIDLKNCFNLNEDVFSIIDNKLYQLFIFKQTVSDETNNATWTKLYVQELSNDVIKSLINKDLVANANLITWLYRKLNVKVITDYILQAICQDNKTINTYQTIINSNFKACLPFLINNQIDLELINELFPAQINNYLNTQLTANKESFLKLLKKETIANPELQRIIISKLDGNYTDNETYLVNSNIEANIINEIKQGNQLLDAANEYQESKEWLREIYKKIKNIIDDLNDLNKNLKLTCLDKLITQLQTKNDELTLSLAKKHIDTLTLYAKNYNRKVLEYDIHNKLLNWGSYNKNNSFNNIMDYCKQNNLLNDKKIKEMRAMQKSNNKFMHPDEEVIENEKSYSNDETFNKAAKDLDNYYKILVQLKKAIADFKNKENTKEEDK